jgi:hypothetical protein
MSLRRCGGSLGWTLALLPRPCEVLVPLGQEETSVWWVAPSLVSPYNLGLTYFLLRLRPRCQ